MLRYFGRLQAQDFLRCVVLPFDRHCKRWVFVVALAVSGSPNHTSFFPSPIFTLSPFSSRLKLRLLSFLFRISYLGLPPLAFPPFTSHLYPLPPLPSHLPPTTAAPSSVIQLFVECCSRQSKTGNQLEPSTPYLEDHGT